MTQVRMLQGRTPLHHAASASAYKVAKLLLLHGSKSTIKDIQVRAFAHVHAILLLLLLLWKSYAACVTESCIAHNVQQQRA
jgi:ankyrin repeat protein